MNAQERKYIANRISEEEKRVCAELRTRPRGVKEPTERLKAIAKSLTDKQLKELVLECLINIKPAEFRKRFSVTAESESEYIDGRYVRTETGTRLNLSDFTLPAAALVPEHKMFQTEYDAETEARAGAIEEVVTLATRCRDRAMLGDGSEALAAFDNFVKELKGLL